MAKHHTESHPEPHEKSQIVLSLNGDKNARDATGNINPHLPIVPRRTAVARRLFIL